MQRLAKSKVEPPRDREHLLVKKTRPDQDLVERGCGNPAVDRRPSASIVGPRLEPSADFAGIGELEVVEMEADRVLTPAGETAIVVMTSDTVDEIVTRVDERLAKNRSS